MSAIRVLIVSDHTLFRQGLCQLCEATKQLSIVGEAEDGQEAVDAARRLRPDVVLMDVKMPVLDGVTATALITGDDPSVNVLTLTVYRDDEYVFEAIKAGAQGYFLKNAGWEEVVRAIQVVYRGEALITPTLAATVLDEFRRFSQPPRRD